MPYPNIPIQNFPVPDGLVLDAEQLEAFNNMSLRQQSKFSKISDNPGRLGYILSIVVEKRMMRERSVCFS
jgi:hypothetical protein